MIFFRSFLFVLGDRKEKLCFFRGGKETKKGFILRAGCENVVKPFKTFLFYCFSKKKEEARNAGENFCIYCSNKKNKVWFEFFLLLFSFVKNSIYKINVDWQEWLRQLYNILKRIKYKRKDYIFFWKNFFFSFPTLGQQTCSSTVNSCVLYGWFFLIWKIRIIYFLIFRNFFEHKKIKILCARKKDQRKNITLIFKVRVGGNVFGWNFLEWESVEADTHKKNVFLGTTNNTFVWKK